MGEYLMDFLCIDFLNSDWRDWRGTGRKEDRLNKPEWLEEFLEKWNLQASLPADEVAITSLVTLRSSLRRMVEVVSGGGELTAEDVAEINRFMAMAPSYRRLELHEQEYQLAQISTKTGWDLVMARIVESFADILVHRDRGRLKICDNLDCQWVYFDESRNRLRRWCDDKACGNLMKVRRFRERQKEKGN
jgi:predicted RNA-binding Zn ribbon-like protein